MRPLLIRGQVVIKHVMLQLALCAIALHVLPLRNPPKSRHPSVPRQIVPVVWVVWR